METEHAKGRQLVLILSGHAAFREDGWVAIDHRLLAEMRAFARVWPGPVSALLPEGPAVVGEPLRVVDPGDLPFGLFPIDLADEQAIAQAVIDAGVVLVSLDERRSAVLSVCRRGGVPFVADVTDAATREYNLGHNVWRLSERRALATLRKQLTDAGDVHCGLDRAGPWSPFGTLLYRRGGPVTCAREHILEERREQLISGAPLRLAFVGPLNHANGAHRLPAIARTLRAMEVPFELDIVGEGPVRPRVRRYCDRQGVARRVNLRGGSAFPPGEMDLLLCPGKETCEQAVFTAMAGGVPILTTFGTQAARLLTAAEQQTQAPAGWRVSARGYGTLIERLHHSRNTILEAGDAAWTFASRNSLDANTRRRVRHLLGACRRTAVTPPPTLPRRAMEVG